jgi:hypothetical protein
MVKRVDGSDLFFAKSPANERPNKRAKALHIRSLTGAGEWRRGEARGWGPQAKVSTPEPAWPGRLARVAATGTAGTSPVPRPAPG